MAIKVGTCCHCGAKTTFDLASGGRQALSCDSCGAPLTETEFVGRPARAGRAPQERRRATPQEVPPEVSGAHLAARRGRDDDDDDEDDRRDGGRRRKKKKGLVARLIDGIEDIADDIFD